MDHEAILEWADGWSFVAVKHKRGLTPGSLHRIKGA
jgi:hypothetical protein